LDFAADPRDGTVANRWQRNQRGSNAAKEGIAVGDVEHGGGAHDGGNLGVGQGKRTR
jgi:hypothetical protein